MTDAAREWGVVADGHLMQCTDEPHARAAATATGGVLVSRPMPGWVDHDAGTPLVDEPRPAYDGHPLTRIVDHLTASDVEHPEWQWGWTVDVDLDPVPRGVQACPSEADARAAVAHDPVGRVLCVRTPQGWREA